MTSCLNLSASRKDLSAPCPKKYFLQFTDFRVDQLRNLGLVLFALEMGVQTLTYLLTQVHMLLWAHRSSKSVISGMTSKVIAIVL